MQLRMASKQIPEKQDLEKEKQTEMEKLLQKEGTEIQRQLLCRVWTMGVTAFVALSIALSLGLKTKRDF